MAVILPTHDPFLQSRAQVLVLPVSTDGNVLHPVLTRCKTLFADNYQQYRQRALLGELMLGQVMLTAVARQSLGLGISTSSVSHIANLMVQKSISHAASERMLLMCLGSFKSIIYQLMRYQGVRRVSFFVPPLLMTKNDQPPSLTAQAIFDGWHDVFCDVPKLTILLHFSKETILPQKTLENPV